MPVQYCALQDVSSVVRVASERFLGLLGDRPALSNLEFQTLSGLTTKCFEGGVSVCNIVQKFELIFISKIINVF